MYIENKDGVAALEAVIGKVSLSKTGKTLRYGDQEFQSLCGRGFLANYYDQDGFYYWISGCRKDGNDGLYNIKVFIDKDIREEYWAKIRKMPERKDQKFFTSRGKYRVGRHDLKNKTGNV